MKFASIFFLSYFISSIVSAEICEERFNRDLDCSKKKVLTKNGVKEVNSNFDRVNGTIQFATISSDPEINIFVDKSDPNLRNRISHNFKLKTPFRLRNEGISVASNGDIHLYNADSVFADKQVDKYTERVSPSYTEINNLLVTVAPGIVTIVEGYTERLGNDKFVRQTIYVCKFKEPMTKNGFKLLKKDLDLE